MKKLEMDVHEPDQPPVKVIVQNQPHELNVRVVSIQLSLWNIVTLVLGFSSALVIAAVILGAITFLIFEMAPALVQWFMESLRNGITIRG